MKIITNHNARPILDWYELTPEEQKEFNWIDDPNSDYSFFRYKGQVYCLANFMRVDGDSFKGWDGYSGDSFFSGILVKYANDYEDVIVGMYLS